MSISISSIYNHVINKMKHTEIEEEKEIFGPTDCKVNIFADGQITYFYSNMLFGYTQSIIDLASFLF